MKDAAESKEIVSKKPVILFQDDWEELSKIMTSVTWGTENQRAWRKLNERITERNGEKKENLCLSCLLKLENGCQDANDYAGRVIQCTHYVEVPLTTTTSPR